MNRRLNQYPFSCDGCGQHYPIATTCRNRRNGEWVCNTCWETPSKITQLPAADITHCDQCGLPVNASNRTISTDGRVVHGGPGRTCPNQHSYTTRGANHTGRRRRQR